MYAGACEEFDDVDFCWDDEIGGSHGNGKGNMPDGTFCNQCPYETCSICPRWIQKNT